MLLLDFGRSGGISNGTWWQITKNTTGVFQITREANTNNGILIYDNSITIANKWSIYVGPPSSTYIPNSLVFSHFTSGTVSQWWLNGTQNGTNSEISDIRIKKEIEEIENPLELLMKIKPKKYYLREDLDYKKKFGIIAQDINEEEDLKFMLYQDKEYIADLNTKASYGKIKIGEIEEEIQSIEDNDVYTEPTKPTKKIKEIFEYVIRTDKNLNGSMNIDDELKLVSKMIIEII